jgi:uncharacterized iron-regulated membrane protein
VRLNILNRKVHYWASALVALPVLVILLSGLTLQLKKQWTWVQPPEQRGTGKEPSIDLEGILASVRGEPSLGVQGWDDVNRIDVRPGRGMAKVWLHSGWEAQVDLGTGAVLQSAYRRSDLIESIHDGSFFAGDWSKLGLFLPSGAVLLLLWGSGLWMFWQPLSVKLKRRLRARPAPVAVEPQPALAAAGGAQKRRRISAP